MYRLENEYRASEQALVAVAGKGELPAELPDARSSRYYGEHGEVKVRYRRLENEDNTSEQAPSGLRPFPLPAELRDMIYDLCYGEEREIKVRFRRDWRNSEILRGPDFVRTTFPTTFLAHLLVSKQYFDEAVQVWAQSKVFILNYPSCDYDWAYRADTAAERQLLRFIRSVKVSDIYPPGGRTIATMLSLQHVTVQIVEVMLTSETLKWWQNQIIESLLQYRGLRSLTLQLQHSCQRTTLQEAVWNTNWDRFQLQVRELVNDIVLQPREQTSATRRPWTFDRALKEAMAARNARHGLTPTPTLKIAPKRTITKGPLTDLEIQRQRQSFCFLP